MMMGSAFFSVASDGALTSVFNITDNVFLNLNGAASLSTAVVSDTTYLFVAGNVDDGVSVFSVASAGALTSVSKITDDPTLQLNGDSSVSTAVVSGTTYLFVAGTMMMGSAFFSVASAGAWTSVFNISDDPTLQLNGDSSVSTAVVFRDDLSLCSREVMMMGSAFFRWLLLALGPLYLILAMIQRCN